MIFKVFVTQNKLKDDDNRKVHFQGNLNSCDSDLLCSSSEMRCTHYKEIIKFYEY